MDIPKNLEECFTFLTKVLSEEDKKRAMDEQEFGIGIHHTLGRTLRNEWKLWEGSVLAAFFNGIGIHHADDMTGIIFTSYHRHLNDEDLRLDEQVKAYQEYWAKQYGVDDG